MSNVLGIDVGTNSIGWALIEDGKRVIDMGVRIFPVGVKEDDYAKSGSEKSKNATRRDARHARRTYDRYRQRRQHLEKALHENGMMFDKTTSLPAKELYGLRRKGLDERLEKEEFARVLFLLNQRRGFKSNRKGQSNSSEEDKGLIGQMNSFQQELEERGFRTPGEYFASLFDDQPEGWHNENEPTKRIRKEHRVRRSLYETEFDLLWQKQSEFYPELTDDLRDHIRDYVIFYQRRLKSAKHLVSKCRFEPKKRVIPKSHPLFQQFRIWTTINNMRITYGERVNDPFTNQERIDLGAELNSREYMTHSQIKKFMGWPSSTKFNDMPQKILGNVTVSRLESAVGSNWYHALSSSDKERLWHNVYCAEDDEELSEHAQKNWKMTDDQADRLVTVNLEVEYGDLSFKAISKILPHLEDGYDYASACAMAGYHHSFDAEKQGKDRILADKLDLTKQEPLRNPLVQMSVNECARLINAVIDQHGKPDRVRVELLRELKKPKKVREQRTNKLREKQRERDAFKEFLIDKKLVKDPRRGDLMKFELWLELEHSSKDLQRLAPELNLADFKKFRSRVNAKDEEKYRLWLECGRVSPYTGNIIPLSKLFTEEIEVEHILPFSRSLDNSFMNKTLSEAEFNSIKGNLTPMEYFKDRKEELRAFKERVKSFSAGKQEKLLAENIDSDFKNSQLTNTAYIGREVTKMLYSVCKDVKVSSGAVTSLLRRQWGLGRLIWDGTGDKKNRDDHRHHAIDALVVAATTDSVIKQVSDLAQETPYGTIQLKGLKFPWPTFQLEASEHIGHMLISYKNGKRLLSSKKNPYRYARKPMPEQRTRSVRGQLHEDTLYGQIMHPEKGELVYVVKKSLEGLSEKDLPKIIDKGLRDSILEHVKNNGGKWSSLKETVYMKSKKGAKVPIKTVRVEVPAEDMIQLRPNENKKLFVKPGNNYCLAIYEDSKTGKRDFETVSFYTASQNALNKQPLYPSEKKGKPLLMTLQQKDLVVLYDNHPDEIDWNNPCELFDRLYMVRKFDRNGLVGMVKHNRTNVDPGKVKDYEPGAGYTKRVGGLKAVKVIIDIVGKLHRT
jgi:CRISPR-associated endonuclease Csn1